MAETATLAATIDGRNERFTSKVKGQLTDLSGLSEPALDWLTLDIHASVIL